VRSLEEINAKWSNEVKGLPVEKEEKDNLLRKLEEEMKKELASVEGEKKCVRGEEAEKKGRRKESFGDEDSRFGRKRQFARRRSEKDGITKESFDDLRFGRKR
jgi:hypothetical protein